VVLLGYLERCRKNPAAKLGDDLQNLRRYDLGAIDGVPLSFTDACGLPDGRMLYVAVAERDDGMNLGTMIGVIDHDGSARQTPLREAGGEPTAAKVAALAVDPEWRVYAALRATPELGPRLCRLDMGTMPVRSPLKL
jgi:hypothetical protein